MKKPLLLLVMVLAMSTAAAATEKPCSTPAHRAFDFWIGDWEVTKPDGSFAGRNRVEAVLGGCALHESWTGASGFSGHSYNVYDAVRTVWHQTWVDSTGAPLFLEGGIQGASMVLQGDQASREGTVRNRITWTPLKPGQVRQLWEASSDDGKTWKTLFDGLYKKWTGGATLRAPDASK